MFRMFSGSLLNLLLFVFSYIVPKKKDLILFGSGNGYLYKGNPRALFEHICINSNSIQAIWISDNKHIVDGIRAQRNKAYYKKSFMGFYIILRANLIISDQSAKDYSFFGILLGKFNVIQTWHGTGFKNIDILDSREQDIFKKVYNRLKLIEFKKYKLILASSNSDKVRKQLSFRNPNVKVLGSPRNDVFFKKNSNYKSMGIGTIRLDNFNKVFLYAPTYRDKQHMVPFSKYFLKTLSNKLREINAILLIKRHPFDMSIFLTDEYPNIKDISNLTDDVQDILSISDLLITDYSGISTDYSLLERPIIFYIYDLVRYQEQCRTFYYDLDKILPGPFVLNETELLELKWFEKKHYKAKYNKFINMFHEYRDGNSSKRVFNYIRRFLI